LSEALEQQAATAEILSAISCSPTDVRPVFETILERAAKLCEAELASLWLYEGGGWFRLGAAHGGRPDYLRLLKQEPHRFETPFFREGGPWRVGQILDVRDTEPYRRGDPFWARTADHEGMRTLLGVPLVKDGRLVGSISVYRREVRQFTGAQVALVKTFAEQAVIAIENVRLFTELQEKNRALTESLEQQTATADILQVISRSPTEVEPVFEAVVTSAARLCEAHDVAMLLVDGGDLRLVAGVGPLYMSIPPDFRIRLTRGSAATRAVVDRATVHIHDFAAESEEEYPVGRELARRFGHRSMLAVPLLREGVPIGVV
jgi:GAF domain